ncbi:MAG TPA: fumarylacetoacetate hydrolase family protein [Candidatus Limnocylindrales bacterium]|nr:fumarylacetoacetate hydrolase family protein [Candidatus Limnocylindrales bacterium]
MRLATVIAAGRPRAALVRKGRALLLALPDERLNTVRGIAAGGEAALGEVLTWAERHPPEAYLDLDALHLGPVVPDPGAIYTIGHNYRSADAPDDTGPERPLVYGKAASSVGGDGWVVGWDRAITENVDAEIELGVVIGTTAASVAPEKAMEHVFGYTCINDMSSRDPWLDGDQWLIGKSMPGFCPVGPVVVTRDELDPADLRLGCTINGTPTQEGRTSWMRFAIPQIVAYLSRHLTLRPGDLIATGTPHRLAGPIGPDDHLQPGDVVTVWVEGIGELTTTIS